MNERPVSVVPKAVLVVLAVALTVQFGWHHRAPAPAARAEALPPAPAATALELMGLGDRVVVSKLVMLWLQAFDHQPGISVPFRSLDYARVEAWLERAVALDPRSRYPFLAASRLYAQVPDVARQKRMLDFVHRHFLVRPNERWPWLAQATLLAKHRLGDLDLALRYARDLTEHAVGPGVPFWVRDMTVIILAEMGEVEAARGLVAALMAAGNITDPAEIAFLEGKLEELKRAHTPSR